MKKIKPDELNFYSYCILTQSLKHGIINCEFTKTDSNKWTAVYSTNSTHHICPYDGVFRKCESCGALEEDFDVNFCENKLQILSTEALCAWINDCYKAEVPVKLIA